MTPINEDARQETRNHITQVGHFISDMVLDLAKRIQDHDASKLQSPEVEVFDEYTAKLRGLTYGSDEYKDCLAGMKPALEHHYSNNRHHPEHFENGINDMTLVDLVEMLCDWKAATMRHADGDIFKSIQINSGRFEMSPQLAKILENTVKIYFGW